MEYTIIDKKTEADYRKILLQIRRLQNGDVIDSLKTMGVDTSHQTGASYVSLKELGSHYEANLQLALLLWNTRRREEQIMACMLLPADADKEIIMQLVQNCLNFEVAEYFGSLFLYRHPGLPLLAEEWKDSDIPYRQTALLAAVARHILVYKDGSKIELPLFRHIVLRNYREKYVRIIAERHRLDI